MSIRYYRRVADITQSELAVAIGVERSTVAKWETKKKLPDESKLQKIASFLECTVDDLLREEKIKNVKRN